ncbi:hypothetical protein OYC64_012062 [Pagothenia borchgrevinki]|uniref:Uncharacterized protein n=1 Tax=Pagothenia borchgrevinki TaxID=8213 RepID=A0ABD2G9F2_PAGBO
MLWLNTCSLHVSVSGPEAEIQHLDVLHSVYQLQDFTFTGTFSSVAECNNTETKETLAIKIFKKGSQKRHRAGHAENYPWSRSDQPRSVLGEL